MSLPSWLLDIVTSSNRAPTSRGRDLLARAAGPGARQGTDAGAHDAGLTTRPPRLRFVELRVDERVCVPHLHMHPAPGLPRCRLATYVLLLSA